LNQEVRLNKETHAVLCEVLEEILKQGGKLDTQGLKELHKPCQEPLTV